VFSQNFSTPPPTKVSFSLCSRSILAQKPPSGNKKEAGEENLSLLRTVYLSGTSYFRRRMKSPPGPGKSSVTGNAGH